MQLQYAFNESMNDGYKFLFTYEILRGVHAIRLKSIQSSLSLQRSFFMCCIVSIPDCQDLYFLSPEMMVHKL